jgi:capsular polysaccharide transport system permease protein
MELTNIEGFDLWSAAARQRHVLFALMLRNIRTRFFGNGLGYLVGIAWPLTHILIIVGIFVVMGRTAPYGDSTVLFVATGVVPFMTFGYLARYMMWTVVRARPLLAFPEVKVLDVLLATALLEILAAACVTIVLIIIAWFAGIDVMPRDTIQAAYAFGTTILLGLGFGLTNSVIVLAAPPWFTGYILVHQLLWISSGIFFVPDALPRIFREALAYNPVLQCIEWTRSAYYEGYGDLVLDRPYVIGFGCVTIFLGLLLERAMRGHILAKQ